MYVSLLLLDGDIESNPGPRENKREASGEPGRNPPQNKKRKGEKVDSEEDIDFTVIRLTERPLAYKVLEGNKTMFPGGVENEAPSMGSKKRGRKAKVKRKVIFEKKRHFMPLIDLHKKCCEKESITINVKEIKSDIPQKGNTRGGFYYHNSRNVTILFKVNNSIEIQSARLDNLMQRGFPVSHIPTICLLQKDLLDEIAAKSEQPIQFTMVKTDTEDQSPQGLLGL